MRDTCSLELLSRSSAVEGGKRLGDTLVDGCLVEGVGYRGVLVSHNAPWFSQDSWEEKILRQFMPMESGMQTR